MNQRSSSCNKETFQRRKAHFLKKSQCLPNTLPYDNNLTSEAIHLLVALNALPESGWTIVKEDIKKRLNWKRDKFGNAVKNCIKFGYMRVTQNRTEKGKFLPNIYEFDMAPSFLGEDPEKCPDIDCEPEEAFPPSEISPSENDTPYMLDRESSVSCSSSSSLIEDIKEHVLRPVTPLPSESENMQKKNLLLSSLENKNLNAAIRWKLSESQAESFSWLKAQGIDSDDGKLSWWAKTYDLERLMDAFYKAKEAKARSYGRYMTKLLEKCVAVNKTYFSQNLEFATQYKEAHKWNQLEILQNYVKYPEGELYFNMNPMIFIETLMNKHQIAGENEQAICNE